MHDQPPHPDDQLPLSPQFYNVLLALGLQTMHGYGIIQAFEALTEGRETLLPGSLYGTLARMAEAGMLEEADAPPGQTSAGPKRRYYRMTEHGRAVMKAESRRMERLLFMARERGLAPGGAR